MKKTKIISIALCALLSLPFGKGGDGLLAQNIGINTTGAIPTTPSMLEVLQPGTTAGSISIYSLHSGAITGTGYGLWSEKTGASTTNIAGYFSASGGTNNYAIIVPAGGGNVGIGTTSPGYKLDVQGGSANVGTLYGTYVMYGTLGSFDTRATNPSPETYNMGVTSEFKGNAANGLSDGGTYNSVLSVRQWSSSTDWSGGGVHQLGFTQNGNLWQRYSQTTGSWGAWNKILTSGNISSNINGTTNYIAKFTSANAVGNSQIFDDGTNVGIGSTSPLEKLRVAGRTFLDPQPGFTGLNAKVTLALGDDDTGINWGGDGIMDFWSQNTVMGRMRYYSGGDESFSFGTTATSPSDEVIIQSSGTTSAYFGLKVKNSAGTDQFVVRSDGNTGIGTTGPTAQFHTTGTVRLENYPSGIIGTDASGNLQTRSIAISGTGITIVNGNGVAGNPTLNLNFGNSPASASGGGGFPVGNFGQYEAHGTYTDFNVTPNYWGWNYVQGAINAPNATSSQWYRNISSLGSNYAGRGVGGYSLELAFPRYNQASAGVWMRTVENGTISGWTRIDANGIGVSGTTNYVAKFISANAIGNSQIFDNGTNVGIGNTGPGYKLDVYGPSGNYPAKVGSPDGYLLFGPANTGWSHFATDRPRFYFNTGGTFDTGNIGSYDEDLSLQTSGTTRITVLNSNGNVGIGTTGPSRKLEVNGDIKLAYGYQVYLGENVSANGKIGINFHTDADPNYWIGKPAGVWTQPLHIGFYTGVKIGANTAYGGTKFYNSSDMATEIMSVGNGDNHVRVPNYLFAQYLNSTDNSVASGVTGVMVKQGDNYFRTGTAAAIKTFLNGTGNGWIENQFAGAQTANHWVSGSSRALEVYAGSWFRNDASGTGLYNQTNGRHFYSDGAGYWSLTTGNGLIFRDAYASTIQGYVYNDGTNFGILHRGGGWGFGTSTTRAFVAQSLMVNGTGTPSYALHVLGDIYANGGWLRVSGNQGLYWESWGGGFYMSDATWIRTYGSKNFYHDAGIMRTDGEFDVGPGGNRFIVQTGGNVGVNTTTPAIKFDSRYNFAGNISTIMSSNSLDDPGIRPDGDTWGYCGFSNARWWRSYAIDGFWTSHSKHKTNISDLTPEEIDSSLIDLRNIRSIRYSWIKEVEEMEKYGSINNADHAVVIRSEPYGEGMKTKTISVDNDEPPKVYDVPLNIGFTVESLPKDIVDETGENYSNSGMFGLLIASIKAIDRKVEELNTMKTIPENKLAIRTPELPERLLMDYGVDTLKNGRAYINLDKRLTINIHVDETHPIKVFIQLEGECNGVYVTNKSSEGFLVVELNNGNSNIPFSWTVVTNRKDR